MIYDKIENAGRYLGISEHLDKAIHYMMDTDFSSLEDGRHVIDGENVFVNVMQADTKTGKEEYESHRAYYDIQIDISGSEDILFSEEFQVITQPYREDGDIGFGTCRCEAVCHLGSGRFAVCEPEEPHLPGVAAEGREEHIRKAVIKVRR